jgi:hypothetical protein
MINRALRLVAIALLIAGNLLGGGCAWKHRSRAICSDCGRPACQGCRHAPDGPTGGYHCTIWRPLEDPCWYLGLPHAATQGEQPPHEGGASAEQLPPVYMPETVPPQ